MYSNFLYNYFIYYLDNVLDHLLYYKIYIQENYYFKTLQSYIYPPNKIIYARLHNKNSDNYLDITNEFTNLALQCVVDNKNIEWNNLVDNYNDKFYLDIKYTINGINYKIIYSKNDIIKFPPYSVKKINEYNDIDEYKINVLFAELCNKENEETKDITRLIKEYAGPLDNFYQDCDNINISIDLIKNDNSQTVVLNDQYINIIDSQANDIKFNKGDILELK